MTSTRLPAPIAAPAAVTVGLLSMAAGLAAGHLVGAFISPSASPLLAVGSSAIDLTPTWLEDFAVRTFGTYDKVVLLSGMAVVIAATGVVAGLISRRSRTPGLLLIVVLGGVAGVAVLTRPTTGSWDVLAPLAALVTSAGTFATLHRLGRPGYSGAYAGTGVVTPAGDGSAAVPRRTLLAGSAVVAAGA